MQHTWKSLFRPGPLALLAAATVAHAGSDGNASKFVPVAEAVTLEATEFAFKPDKLSMPADREITIRLKNEGVVAHNLIVVKGRDEEKRPKIESIQKGDTAELTLRFADAGTYDFYCDVPGHKQAGMRGTIRVVPPGEFSAE